MTEDEAKGAVAEVIKSVGTGSVKDMGKVMAELKAKYAAYLPLPEIVFMTLRYGPRAGGGRR